MVLSRVCFPLAMVRGSSFSNAGMPYGLVQWCRKEGEVIKKFEKKKKQTKKLTLPKVKRGKVG